MTGRTALMGVDDVKALGAGAIPEASNRLEKAEEDNKGIH